MAATTHEVRGHLRHLDSGRVVTVRGHERHNPGQLDHTAEQQERTKPTHETTYVDAVMPTYGGVTEVGLHNRYMQALARRQESLRLAAIREQGLREQRELRQREMARVNGVAYKPQKKRAPVRCTKAERVPLRVVTLLKKH